MSKKHFILDKWGNWVGPAARGGDIWNVSFKHTKVQPGYSWEGHFCRSSQSCFSCSSYFQNKNCDVYIQRQQTEISCWAVIIPDMSLQQLMRQKPIKILVCNYVVQTSTPEHLFWWGQVIFQEIQHSFSFFTCVVCQISPRFLNSRKVLMFEPHHFCNRSWDIHQQTSQHQNSGECICCHSLNLQQYML